MYMAYFEPRIYQAVNADPLRFDIMKFCCTRRETNHRGARRKFCRVRKVYKKLCTWVIKVCIKVCTGSMNPHCLNCQRGKWYLYSDFYSLKYINLNVHIY